MRSDVVTTTQAMGLAFQGAVFQLVLVLISILKIEIFSLQIACSFLPLAALYFWPYRAHFVLSMVFVLLLGLFQDIVSNGPMGMWALINTILFTIIDPSGDRHRSGFFVQWGGFVILLIISIAMSYFLARISLGYWARLNVLAGLGLMTAAGFPIVYLSVKLSRRYFKGAVMKEGF